jgi:hypothetical protein
MVVVSCRGVLSVHYVPPAEARQLAAWAAREGAKCEDVVAPPHKPRPKEAW